MKILRQILFTAGFLSLTLLGSNCGKLSTGVCTGYSAEYNSTYCKDGWTKDECDEWNDLGVNGVTWTFYKGRDL